MTYEKKSVIELREIAKERKIKGELDQTVNNLSNHL